MIPKIIHQIWLGDQSKRPMSEINRLKEMNSSWEYILWTENEIKSIFGELINQRHFDSLVNLNSTIQDRIGSISDDYYYCGQSDILRYEILYRYGGFYVDADTVPIKEFSDELCSNEVFAAYENEIARPGLIANGYLGSCKDSELMKIFIDEIYKKDTILGIEPWISTGPLFLTNTIKEYNYDKIKIYPSYYFIPNHYTGQSYQGDDSEHVYCDQLFLSTTNKQIK